MQCTNHCNDHIFHDSFSFVLWPPQESEGPFPYPLWKSTESKNVSNHPTNRVVSKAPVKTSTTVDQVKRLPLSLQSLPGLQDMFHANECIGFKLPPLYANAGAVFRHAVKTVELLLQREYPCIFKLGYTHNALFRWENPAYGYALSRDKWSHMYVIYITDEPYSCAMLEAGLIEKFQGNLSYFSVFCLNEFVF